MDIDPLRYKTASLQLVSGILSYFCLKKRPRFKKIFIVYLSYFPIPTLFEVESFNFTSPIMYQSLSLLFDLDGLVSGKANHFFHPWIKKTSRSKKTLTFNFFGVQGHD